MIFFKELLRRLIGYGQSLRLTFASVPWPERAEGAATLIIAPHQDDEILGCGLLLADRCAKKESIHIVYLTDGSESHPGHPLHSPTQLALKRKQEAYQVASLLGLPQECLHFLELKDGQLPLLSATEKEQAQNQLRGILSRHCFDEVFTPLFCDGSTEHEAAFDLVRSVIPADIRLLQYPVWARWAPWRLSKALKNLPTVYYLQLPHYQKIKKAALSLYRTQTAPLPPWSEPLLSRSFLRMFHQAKEFYFEFK
jgi:N-acetylglucosamine malate deacetylase 1